MALAKVCVSSDLLPAGRLLLRPVCSDLASDIGGPSASLQIVKVPQESNTVACCHDERPTGKPDEDASTYNCLLKGGGGGLFQSLPLPSDSVGIHQNKGKEKTAGHLNIQLRPRLKSSASQENFWTKTADVQEFTESVAQEIRVTHS